MQLDNKKILIIMPFFFDYHVLIKNELESMGAEVYCIQDDFFSESILYKYIYRRIDCLKFLYANKRYMHMLKKLPTDMDYIFIIKGSAVSSQILDFLRKQYINSKIIMYQWDSVENNKNALNIALMVDEKFTFDPIDAKKYNWKYRPLFYSDISEEDNERKYDFAFIGTLYYNRAILLKKMKKFCAETKCDLFNYIYVNKAEYYIHKYILRDKRYSILSREEVKFLPLSSSGVQKKYSETKIFVDYAADNQNGLTMRTIESIGNRCKIITNNKNILLEDFYNPKNIYVYDIENFYIPTEFIETPYEELNEKIYYKYSLAGWIKEIFGIY